MAKVKEQPAPITNCEEMPIILLVMEDLVGRARVGHDRYGTLLTAQNNRDHLVDAYFEALDLACYLRAEIEKRLGEPEDLVDLWEGWDDEGTAGEQD